MCIKLGHVFVNLDIIRDMHMYFSGYVGKCEQIHSPFSGWSLMSPSLGWFGLSDCPVSVERHTKRERVRK